jgi:hypothetical protein
LFPATCGGADGACAPWGLTLPSEHVSLNRLGFEEKIIILVVVVVAVGMWKSALSISKVCGKGGKQHYRFPGFP